MRLWIDDIRKKPSDYDLWAKSADEAIEILKTGVITHVSFDHDLGDVHETDGPIVTWVEHQKTGYDVAVWIEEQAYDGTLQPFTYQVHSSNPVGANNIYLAMHKAEQYWSRDL